MYDEETRADWKTISIIENCLANKIIELKLSQNLTESLKILKTLAI